MKITQFLWEKFGQIEKHYGESGAAKGFHALTFPSHFSSIHSGFVNSPPPQREIRKERQKARTISISHFFSLHIFKWMYKVWKEAKSLLQLQKWDLLFLGFDRWSLKTEKKQANKQTKQKGINCIQGSSDSCKRDLSHAFRICAPLEDKAHLHHTDRHSRWTLYCTKQRVSRQLRHQSLCGCKHNSIWRQKEIATQFLQCATDVAAKWNSSNFRIWSCPVWKQ